MRNWRIRRGERGWFTYHYLLPNGCEIRSYPIPTYWWAIPLYPWMVWKAIEAIQQHRRVFWGG